MRPLRFVTALLALAGGVWGVAGAQGALEVARPVAASPGSPAGLSIGHGCPTFSWGAVPGAESYELVVYRIGEHSDETTPVLHQRIAGAALGWTPSLDRCLEPAGQYAWSVRALGDEAASDWSLPSLFVVVDGPSQTDFEEALAVVQTYLSQSSPSARGFPNKIRESQVEPTAQEVVGSPILDPPSVVAVADSVGVRAEVSDTTGVRYGVQGVTLSTTNAAAGLVGEAKGVSGVTYGVLGVSSSANEGSAGVLGEGRRGVLGIGQGSAGTGVMGLTEGTPGVFPGAYTAVLGATNQLTGVAGVFDNTAVGGTILSGRHAGIEVFNISTDGTVNGIFFEGDGSGVVNLDAGNLREESVVSALDPRYINAAGDNMAGPLMVPSGGLRVGADELVADIQGRIGIGTATPTEKFEVIGTAKATGFVGDGSAVTGVDAVRLDGKLGAEYADFSTVLNLIERECRNFVTPLGPIPLGTPGGSWGISTFKGGVTGSKIAYLLVQKSGADATSGTLDVRELSIGAAGSQFDATRATGLIGTWDFGVDGSIGAGANMYLLPVTATPTLSPAAWEVSISGVSDINLVEVCIATSP